LCPDGRPNGTCTAAPGAGCFASAEEVYDSDTDSLVAERTYGCLPPDDNGGLFACKAGLSPHGTPTAIECCRRGDLCNRALYPMYERRPEAADGTKDDSDGGDWSLATVNPAVFHLVLLCTVTVCVVSLVFFVTCLYLKYQRKELVRRRHVYRQAQQADCSGGTLQDLLEQTSGTGAGLPLLVQRTIAKQVWRSIHILKGVPVHFDGK
jgi:bone morphogenetic protein receptor type-1B